MKNQVDVINGMSEEEGIAHYLNSSLNKAAIDLVKSDILAGKTKLLYVAPESLTKDEYVDFLKAVKISFYAIDEAHCISEWGHDFRPEHRKIRDKVDEIGKAPLIALTATATDKVRTDIKKSLGIVDAKEFKSSFNRPNLYYEVRQKPSSDDATNVQIVKFIRQHPGKSGIIYCLSRKKVEELAAVLCANNIKAAPYHAGLDSATRSQTQDDFLQEDIDVIVAMLMNVSISKVQQHSLVARGDLSLQTHIVQVEIGTVENIVGSVHHPVNHVRAPMIKTFQSIAGVHLAEAIAGFGT
jgi:ATP-dependent DNA helicase RecQ